ncbi:hypothetical protein PAHAL_4G028000 [Panicum hallii]|jgi:hypothetical protein|uniref:Uncharacterized protein n=1 Tax=Panicum hallii TaxID=206008 RepID=A0A2S3HGZ0_9POAL|nr:hypothetical protein PAHAL_4G028000 [Panicum hallii]
MIIVIIYFLKLVSGDSGRKQIQSVSRCSSPMWENNVETRNPELFSYECCELWIRVFVYFVGYLIAVDDGTGPAFASFAMFSMMFTTMVILVNCKSAKILHPSEQEQED